MTSKVDLLAEAFMAQVLRNANYLGQMGFLNQDLPGLKLALGVLRLRKSRQNEQQEDTSARQVQGVSAAVAVSQSLSRNMSEVERRLAALAGAQTGTEANIDGQTKHPHSLLTQSRAQPDLLDTAA